MLYKYRYDIWGAHTDSNVNMHPQVDMERLGIKYVKVEPCPIADCWFVYTEESLDALNLPGYIQFIGEVSNDESNFN